MIAGMQDSILIINAKKVPIDDAERIAKASRDTLVRETYYITHGWRWTFMEDEDREDTDLARIDIGNAERFARYRQWGEMDYVIL